MAKERERSRRDDAGIGPDPSDTGELVRLEDLDGFTVASGEPDIRGWEVRTVGGREIGEVDDLLIDPMRAEVVKIDVDINGSDRHAEVPIRAVQLDRDRKVVIVDSGDVEGYVPSTVRARLSDNDRMRLNDTYRAVGSRDVRYERSDLHRGDDSADRVEVAERELQEARETAARERELREQREEELREIQQREREQNRKVEERVVESRPVVVEDVVVRRRKVDPNETEDSDLVDDNDRLRP
ncbi:MAG TPA: PRC-barrel domain-containing protein [Longimicrobiales bacterium]|nr:PRC-barrel domain-containing protein [Longimicrobiales bacterium]